MQIGYARTSTLEQKAGLDAQVRDLKAAGVKKIFSEQLSSVDAERPQLEAALDFAREGDVLVITKIDRIARSVAHLCEIEAKLHAKGASLKVLNPALDTSTPIGRLVFNMVGAIAQFERALIGERVKAGLGAARRNGKRIGRPPIRSLTPDERNRIRKEHRSGKTLRKLAESYGISLWAAHSACRAGATG